MSSFLPQEVPDSEASIIKMENSVFGMSVSGAHPIERDLALPTSLPKRFQQDDAEIIKLMTALIGEMLIKSLHRILDSNIEANTKELPPLKKESNAEFNRDDDSNEDEIEKKIAEERHRLSLLYARTGITNLEKILRGKIAVLILPHCYSIGKSVCININRTYEAIQKTITHLRLNHGEIDDVILEEEFTDPGSFSPDSFSPFFSSPH